MGGYFSGGGRDAPKTDSFRRVDLARLKQLKMLEPGCRSRLVWSRDGEEVGSMVIESHASHLILDYRSRNHGGEWQPIRDTIPLDYTYPNFGGERAWFRCPSCHRRKRVLYGGRYFRCRNCYRATYPSQYERDYFRSLNRAQAIREKLGGGLCTDDPFPPKPKRMRWKTYYRLMERGKAADREFFGAVMGAFGGRS